MINLNTEINYEKKFQSYISLFEMDYKKAVSHLLKKYGPAKDDYYREKSYFRFLNDEIKTITKGKYSRTSEGLFCHHIYENEELMLSNIHSIKSMKLPYHYQKKENLVYCDLIEHAILHILIADETNHQYGYPGYISYLEILIKDWYINDLSPKPNWMKACKERAYLPPYYIKKIISKIDYILSNNETVNKQIAEENKRLNIIKETRRREELSGLLKYKYLYENHFDDLVSNSRDYFINMIMKFGNERDYKKVKSMNINKQKEQLANDISILVNNEIEEIKNFKYASISNEEFLNLSESIQIIYEKNSKN